MFQFPVIYDTMTVAENLAFPLRNRGVAAERIAQRVGEIAEMLELSGQLNQRAAGLAADAKQKISLGRGLVREDVSAVLFDEPLTVIDPHLKWQLRRKLKQIHQRAQAHADLRHARPGRGADLRRAGGGDDARPGGADRQRRRSCSSGRSTPSSATSSARRA